MSAGGGDCYKNSAYATAPDMKITALGSLTLSGAAVAGGNDTVVFNNGTDAYSITGKDSVVKLATVWNESEFNVVGDAGGSTGETNNLDLGTCTVAGGATPSIKITESN